MTKVSIREYYRQRRRLISPTEKINSSQALAQFFIDNFDYHKKNIAVYLANDNELDVQFLVEILWKKESHVFLPVINLTTQHLQFAAYSSSTMMKENQYGISEPESHLFIPPENLDIVLMPLVAFDKTGTRLGMGKGYYDKSFAFCREAQAKPVLIGVAYSCQYCDKLPVDDWDVPLASILTEKKLIMLNEK